jgi:hypothetical protein
LNEIGYFEHRNVAIEYRWAANQVDRLQSSVTELVSRPVSVIAAFGTVPDRQSGINWDSDRFPDGR